MKNEPISPAESEAIAQLIALHDDLSTEDAIFVVKTVQAVLAEAMSFARPFIEDISPFEGESSKDFNHRRKHSATRDAIQTHIAHLGGFLADNREFRKETKNICSQHGKAFVARTLFYEMALPTLISEYGLGDMMEDHLASRRQKSVADSHISSFFSGGLHLVFVRSRKQAEIYLAALGLKDTPIISPAATDCPAPGRGNALAVYIGVDFEIPKKKHLHLLNKTALAKSAKFFIFTSLSPDHFMQLIEDFTSVSTLAEEGNGRFSVRVEKNQNGPSGSCSIS